MNDRDRLSFVAAENAQAAAAKAELLRIHGDHSMQDADVLVALGGDG